MNAPVTERAFVDTCWELWTYDVWSSKDDGYEVNDRFCQAREHPLRLCIEHHNIGTAQEFRSASPTDAQIRQAFGLRCLLDTDGDDEHIYISRERDGYPIGEMHLVSPKNLHAILNPNLKGNYP